MAEGMEAEIVLDLETGEPRVCVIRLSDAWRWSRTHNNDRMMIGYRFFGKPPSSDAWQAANAIYAELMGLNGADPRTGFPPNVAVQYEVKLVSVK